MVPSFLSLLHVHLVSPMEIAFVSELYLGRKVLEGPDYIVPLYKHRSGHFGSDLFQPLVVACKIFKWFQFTPGPFGGF